MKNKTMITRNPSGSYHGQTTLSDPLLILGDFLRDIGYGKNPDIIECLKRKKGMGFNCSSFDKVNDNIHINLDYVPGLEDLVIPLPDLLLIVEKWMELTAAKVEKIILIEEDDGSFTIKEG